MSTLASPSRTTSEFVPVDLRGFPVDRPTALDLYHLVGGRYVLYCKAETCFTAEARRRLLENRVTKLYARIKADGTPAARQDLAALQALSDSQSLLPVRISFSGHPSRSTTGPASPPPSIALMPTSVLQLVGRAILRLSRNPETLLALIQVTRQDTRLYVHSANVCAYATAVGSKLGLGQEELVSLGIGAFLHDIGKTRVPRAILDKPDRLTEEEMAIVRRHPVWGLQIIGGDIAERPIARRVILQHHERLDGSGYPEGLGGQQVDRLSRLVGLVDVYDMLTAAHSKRATLSSFGALRFIEEEMADQLDHDLLVTFSQVLADGVAG